MRNVLLVPIHLDAPCLKTDLADKTEGRAVRRHGLLVDGYDGRHGEQPLRLLRMERLSKNVLLCVFAGKVAMVDIHQKPESLHCGFSRPDSSANGADYYKEKIGPLPGPVLWRPGDKRVVAIGTLVDTFRQKAGGTKDAYQSAKFAVDMIEGVESVRFQVGEGI